LATDFKSLLSKKVEDAVKPKILPAGTYEGVVKGYNLGESKEKKTPYVEFTYTITSPGEDIMSEDLEGVNWQGKEFRSTFYLTPEADYRLKDFLKSCGIDTDGRSFGETIPDTVRAAVLLSLTQVPNTREEGEFYNNIGRVIGNPSN
jgi:hypothetical protein